MYENHSIIKDTNSYGGKTVGKSYDTFRIVNWYDPVMTFDQLFNCLIN